MKPSYFDTTPPDLLITDYKPGVTNYPREGSPDPFIYIDHDLEPNTRFNGEHHTVYVDGKMGENTQIAVRAGIVSATSLEKDAEACSGMLLLISDPAQSKNSKNIASPKAEYPLIMVVPEERRAEIFSFLVKKFNRNTSAFEANALEQTKETIAAAFPDVPIQITNGFALKSQFSRASNQGLG